MKLKAGVLGAGHLGKIHLKLLQQSDKFDLVGFYDPDETNGKKVEKEFGYLYFSSLDTKTIKNVLNRKIAICFLIYLKANI